MSTVDLIFHIVAGLVCFAGIMFLFYHLGDELHKFSKRKGSRRKEAKMDILMLFLAILAFGYAANHWLTEASEAIAGNSESTPQSETIDPVYLQEHYNTIKRMEDCNNG